MAKNKQLKLEAKIVNDDALAMMAAELEECQEAMKEKGLRDALTTFNKLRGQRGQLKKKILAHVNDIEGPSEDSRQFIVNEVHEVTIRTSERPATKSERKVLYLLGAKLLGDGDDTGS